MASRSEPSPLLTRLTTLNDMARLRILRLLAAHELSVGELARSLQIPQSTVSRHLKLLHEGAWITKRSEGTASLYALAEETLEPEAQELWRVARGQLGRGPTIAEDDSRIREVLAERRRDSKSFFGEIGSAWDRLREDLFGHAFTAEALLGLIDGAWVVADIGCGTGNGTELVAPYVRRVIAVDREASMLASARRRLGDVSNVEFRQGEATALPIDDAAIDAAMFFLVLHHLAEPVEGVVEAARVLRPGGALLVVDMVSHDRESYRHTMGHQHLGFDERAVKGWAKAAGCGSVSYRRLRPDTHARGPGLFVATMRSVRSTLS